MNRKISRISTGSDNLDDLLLGGIETHAITEFYGAAGSGKTQMCHTFAVIAAQKGNVIYIDTEGKFRPERLVSIARSRGLDIHVTNRNWLSNILYVKAMTSYQQEFLNNSLNPLLENEERSISLLIVDSIINNYRAEFLGSSNLAERQQRLYRLMNLLFCIAQKYGIAVVITNQVNSSHSYGKSNSTGGNVVTYVSNYRVYLRRYPTDRIVASIVKSPYHLEGKTSLTLSEKGIVDL